MTGYKLPDGKNPLDGEDDGQDDGQDDGEDDGEDDGQDDPLDHHDDEQKVRRDTDVHLTPAGNWGGMLLLLLLLLMRK